MEPEIQPPSSETPSAPADATLTHEPVIPTLKVKLLRGLRWTFIGSQGLRAGWSVAIFLILAIIFMISVGSAATAIARHFLTQKRMISRPRSR